MPRSNLKMEDYYDDEQLTQEKKKLWPIGFTYLSILSDTIIALVAKVKPLEGRKLKRGSVCASFMARSVRVVWFVASRMTLAVLMV